MPKPKYASSEIELDLGRYELRRNDRRVKLEKKPMELLIFLVGRRDQLVMRKDIVSKLWRSDLFIETETNINNIIRKIRSALGDTAAKPRFLETVVGKGYRFVGPVRVIAARFPQTNFEDSPANESALALARARASSSGDRSGERAGERAGERPALAVQPLLLLGNIPDDHGVCLGFADALASRLANLQGIDVLPTSAMLNAPPDMSPLEAGARLGVRFIVHGGIQESKGQWRLALEMFDTHLQTASFRRKCDLDLHQLAELEDELSKQIAGALNRSLRPIAGLQRPRYSKDPIAYSEFIRGYRLSSSGDPALLEEATTRLANAVARDPEFSLAHATLALVCAMRHFEFDPASAWLEKAEFHCRRALEVNADLPEAHVANAFLLWGPSKNFQHLEAIAELRRALSLQKNLPHAYNRLGTILAHIGLLDHAREMYQRARPFHPGNAISHSIVQVYIWNQEFDLAHREIRAWRAESPANKYPIYFAPQLAIMTEDWKYAKVLLEEATKFVPAEPIVLSLQGLFYALTGKPDQALECMAEACAVPKSFGHTHHTYYQIAEILATLDRPTEAFEWLERSVSTGFACWPFFLNDPCLANLHTLPEFEALISSLQAKYPDHLGLF